MINIISPCSIIKFTCFGADTMTELSVSDVWKNFNTNKLNVQSSYVTLNLCIRTR